jgi:type IV secretion system protein VirD4
MATVSLNSFFYKAEAFFNRFNSPRGEQLDNARFANLLEMANLAHPDFSGDSLLIGETRYKHILQIRPTTIRPNLGHLLDCGPTGRGKTLFMTSQILNWDFNSIIQDPKAGELHRLTSGAKAKNGKVFVIDPVAPFGHRYDPLRGKQTETELYNAAKHLLYDPNEKEVIFTQRATKMLTQILLASRMEEKPPLPYVRFMERLGLKDAAKRLYTLSPELARQFLGGDIKQTSFTDDRFLLSAWGTLSARIYPLLTEEVIRCFTGSDFTAEDILTSEEPITVYLRWPESQLLALSPLIRLVWGSLINDLINTYDRLEAAGRKGECKDVLLPIEEAGRVPLPMLYDAITTARSRGMSFLVSFQSLPQLDAAYGPLRARILRDNCDIQIYRRPGRTDLQTANHIRDPLGFHSVYTSSQTFHNGEETSQSKSEHPVYLLSSQEILQMADDEIIVFYGDLPPFRAKRMDWRRFPVLKRQCNLKPPTLPPLPVLEETQLATDPPQTQPAAFTYTSPNGL